MSKKKYKLVDKDGYTRRNETGETYWLDGVEKIANGDGNKLCSDDVIHYYDHPLLAVLFNPIHANITAARLIEIEIDGKITHDGLKGGCKKAKYTKEITLPALTTEQRVTFAIKISLEYYKNADYKNWAVNWLSGKDRAASAAESAAWSAAWSARSAARSAERSAESAAWSARSAARSAERSAESAAWSARSAARSAERSAESAAWSAERSINKLFIRTIEEIVNE